MSPTKQNNLKLIPIKDIEPNKGQIEGLPKNPRKIEPHRFDKLKKSIEDAPEMLDYRRLLVFPLNDKFVVVAGNMRLKAAKELGYTEMPCYVLDESTPAEKLREYAIKDNIGFGDDDFELLVADWNVDELTGWGMELPNWGGAEKEEEVMQTKTTAGYERAHILISYNPNLHPQVQSAIERLYDIEEIEIEKTAN